MKSRHEPKKKKKKGKSKPVFNDISRGSFPSSSASFPARGQKKNPPRIMIDGVRCARGKRRADTRGINLDLLSHYSPWKEIKIHRSERVANHRTRLHPVPVPSFLSFPSGYAKMHSTSSHIRPLASNEIILASIFLFFFFQSTVS